VTPQLAADIERLGFGTLWLGSSPAGDLVQAEELLDATSTLMLATSIVNMWQDQPEDVAGSFARVQRRHPGRFLLGVGAGHREATRQYARPYETLARYIDVLQAAGVPCGSLVLAALGPKVLGVARDRAAGAIPISSRPGTPAGRGRCWAPARCSRPSTRWCRTPTRTGPARSAGPRCSPISAW
jgi:probable F420-dependent oxidoreductase